MNDKFGTNKEHLAIAKSLLDQFQGFTLCLEAASSWFDFSPAGSLHYHKCEGDLLLNWKDRGYKAIFDVLLVSFAEMSVYLFATRLFLTTKKIKRLFNSFFIPKGLKHRKLKILGTWQLAKRQA